MSASSALEYAVNNSLRAVKLILRVEMIITLLVVLLLLTVPVYADVEGNPGTPVLYPKPQDRAASVANPFVYNRVHRKSNMWMNITNWGYFGNSAPGANDAQEDPAYPGTWAPQCEYPGGSNEQYLFMGALWLGALVQEESYEFPRVSEGSEGWTAPLIHEFYPGEGALNSIEERSSRPNEWNRLGDYVSHQDAISEQDFISSYSDTLTEQLWVRNDPVDGIHFPLGIKISQKSFSWTYNYAQDFILFDYEIENIAGNYLKNLYVGLYVDSDVGRIDEIPDWHQDDICGFQEYYRYQKPDGAWDSTRINIAYISDNDGRPYSEASGSDFTSSSVSGTRVVRAPNPRLNTTFNWWISNGNPDLDFGPSWVDDLSGGWTNTYGTPMGDERKYFVMSNREFDYDQIYVDDPDWIAAHPQILEYYNPALQQFVTEEHDWKIETLENADDLADGYDTRYLISWGPLGVFDHTDEAGNDIFRLNPGESFHMTMAYVCGENFHDSNNPQISNTNIDPDKFNFADIKYNAAWAAWVYDNPMIDTPCFDYGNDHDPNIVDEDGSQGDGNYDTGDGWYGEDTGSDGLYAVIPAGQESAEVYYFGKYMGTYYGPDPDGTEMNGILDPGEDNWVQNIPLPYPDGLFTDQYNKFGTLDLAFMGGNYILDSGDGIPDFQGPPPPEVPQLTYELTENQVILKWKKYPSEDPAYQDPFSRMQDFEGYRIYAGNTGLENDYSLVEDFDLVDFAYYSLTDSMVTYPDFRTNAPADTIIDGQLFYRRAVNNNTGFLSIQETDSTYEYVFENVHSLFPRWYCVTAYDYGDPQSGTEPLETARSANAVYLAPSGNPQNEVIVVPNPYRAYEDYTSPFMGGNENGLKWENQDDGTPDFFPATDRRLEFINLPEKCLIRIFTVAGDLVAIVPHNIAGDDNIGWNSEFSESWDLNSRNLQQVVSGLYFFSVENYTAGNKGKIQTGKFVIIR